MAAWSAVSFGGKSLDDWAKTDERFRFDRKALQAKAHEAGEVTFAGKKYNVVRDMFSCGKTG